MKVTGKRVNRFGAYGLATLMTYSDLVPQMVIEWIKMHIEKVNDYEEQHWTLHRHASSK